VSTVDQQADQNIRVLDTLKLANEWLAANGTNHGAEWEVGDGWRVETRYTWLEGLLIARHPESDESVGLLTGGRDSSDSGRWLDLLKYCHS
jgi:hypothetical protein